MKKERFTNVLIIIGFFLFTVISLSYIQNNTTLTSTYIALAYLWEIAVTVVVLKDRSISDQEKILLLSLIALSSLNVFVNSTSGIILNAFNYSKKLIMYSGSLIWILFCKHAKLDKKTYNIILMFIAVVAISAIYYSNSGFAYEEFGIFLKYGFTNTNHTGMFFSICTIYLMSGLFVYKSKYIKLILIILASYMMYLIYWTGCRSSILAIAFIVLIIIIDVIKKNNIGKKTIFFFSVFPILFVYLYISLIPLLTYEINFGFSDVGKHNATRAKVWIMSTQRVHDNLLFGDYYGSTNGTGESQALNTHLDVLESYGIIPLILFIFFLYQTLTYKKLKNLPVKNRFGIYGFMSCFIIGLFEAGLVSGSSGLFIPAFGFLLLTNNDY